ncbi:MAG: response regulator [Amylibacter sp.]|nr:response regulator [Amylibacter sp.]
MQPLVRILYAEDEPDIQQLVSLVLETLGGFTLKTCSSGSEAVNEVESFAPQLLLFDVMMPDLDGPSALKQIRAMERYKAIPAVFMTAKVQLDEVQGYLDMGAVSVIAKPFDPMTLAEQIQKAWDKVGG